MLIAAIGFAAAAFLAWFSAMPVKFYAPGALFSDLAEDIDAKRDLSAVKTELGAFHDKHIQHNELIMERAATKMQLALFVVLCSVALAIIGQVIAILQAST